MADRQVGGGVVGECHELGEPGEARRLVCARYGQLDEPVVGGKGHLGEVADHRLQTTSHLVGGHAGLANEEFHSRIAEHLVVTDLDGQNERELPLPGAGTVTNLQSADEGDLIGYTFTDAAVGTAGAREALLFTASLTAAQQDADEASSTADSPTGDIS